MYADLSCSNMFRSRRKPQVGVALASALQDKRITARLLGLLVKTKSEQRLGDEGKDLKYQR